jgi:type I restriction enzyme, S subunit
MTADWRKYKLSQLGEIKTGRTPPSSVKNAFGGSFPFVTPRDMNGSKWVEGTERGLTEEGLLSVRSCIVPGRSVAVSCIGSDMGKAVMVSTPSVTNQQINVLLVDETQFNSEYVYYCLSQRQDELKSIAGGSATPILNKGHFSNVEITVPRKCYQDSVVEILSSFDRKIALNRKIIQALEEITQAIFKSWFVDFDPVYAKMAGQQPEGMDAATAALFPSELMESELGLIPKGWDVATLKQLTSKVGSGATPRGGREVYLDEGIALIRSQNVYNSEFVWGGLARISDDAASQLKGVEVFSKDILMNITGASILRTCVVPQEVLPARVNQHVAIIRAKSEVSPRYLHLHLLQRQVKDYLLGLNTGGSREAVTKSHIESVQILNPGRDVLLKFQQMVEPLFSEVENLASQARVLSNLRDTLLPKLLSGELKVKET